MFATTEMQKVPATILSRVQKNALRKITLDELMERLRRIAESEGIEIDRGAVEIIARRGEGSVRDALSLLDQVIAFSGHAVTAVDVATVLGLSDTNFFARLVDLIAAGDHGGILETLQEAAESGRDFKMLYRDLLSFVRSLLLVAGGAPESMLAASPEDLAAIRAGAGKFSYSELLRVANLLLRDDETVNKAEHQRLAVEIALLKAATFPRLRSVEEALSGGGVAELRGSAVAKSPTPQPRNLATSQPDVTAFIEKVTKARPLIGGYLAGAKSHRRDGDRIIFNFDDRFSADSVSEARAGLEQIAAEVFGAPVTIEVATSEEAQRGEAKQSPLRDDPILQAFKKHLGGEIVETRRSK
jgi:DNA polymerase-3 subunit gamma/tau